MRLIGVPLFQALATLLPEGAALFLTHTLPFFTQRLAFFRGQLPEPLQAPVRE